MGMEEKEIVLTYETLYEALRKEKSRDELQKLDASFYKDVLTYLKEKQKTHDDNIAKNDIFSQSESEKTQTQIVNIKKLIKEIYGMRERKIINMALNKSRTQSNIIDTSSLLPEERSFYNSTLSVLDQYRNGVLMKINELREPSITGTIEEEQNEEQKRPQTKKNVKFITQVDTFVDEDLEIHGPYDINDEAELPQKLAELLVSQGKAEEI